LPAVDKYKPEWDERQISSIASKSLSFSSCMELKNEEALAKDTMSVLSYCELALYGISESLQHSNFELPEETTQLCSSLHVGLRHAIALSCKASTNAVLKRRDNVIAEAKSVIRVPQLTGGLHLGESFLFHDSLEEAIKIQNNLDPISTKHASWPDKAKKQTTPQVQSTYSGRDYQGGYSTPKPRGNAPRNDGSGGRSAQGGQRGHKRSYSTY
jgi:hypothetical protein